MQAIFLITLFSLFLSIGASIVVNSTGSTAQITQARVAETTTFLNNLQTAINQITRENLQAGTAAEIADTTAYINNTESLAQLASGRWPDATLDAWGNPMRTFAVRESRVLYNNGTDQVIAPVTGFAFISAGPDRVFQTAAISPTTIASLQGILPPTGADDIVSVFTDELAQRQNWAIRQKHMDKIANAIMRHYVFQTKDYFNQYTTRYLTELQQTSGTTIPDLTTLILSDPNAPTYLDVNDAGNRNLLGIEEDFSILEQALPSSGWFTVQSISNPDKSLTLRLTNGAIRTPWGDNNGNLSYTINLKGAL